uniref:Uncharacterized protein n=1 Tax=Anas platyrhynchos platyrhynchos TaxID=8840 RepID=A0A493U143_ANAPP
MHIKMSCIWKLAYRFCSCLVLIFKFFLFLPHVLAVFLSYFKLLWNKDDSASENSGREATAEREHQYSSGDELCDKDRNNLKNERESNTEGLEALLDDDGDLEVVRRPRSTSDLEAEDLSRDRVYPVILMKGKEDAFEDEEQECTCTDVVKIEHTMATPL